jgi:hypothetical protein
MEIDFFDFTLYWFKGGCDKNASKLTISPMKK